jgi:hypothetical protein
MFNFMYAAYLILCYEFMKQRNMLNLLMAMLVTNMLHDDHHQQQQPTCYTTTQKTI